MKPYHFGCGDGAVSDVEWERVSAIAERLGAEFVRYRPRAEAHRYWFNCENLGHPFDDRKAAEVMEAVGRVKVEDAPVRQRRRHPAMAGG